MHGARNTALSLVGVVVVMGGLAWAAVPFYNWFCRVTGYGGTTAVAESDGGVEALDRMITVSFDGSTAAGMAWTFHPAQREIELRIGETGIAFYEATNPTDRPIAGTASYNVTPYAMGSYFTKIACFCFTEQVLAPGETVQMPVTFYIDPEMVDDRETERVTNVTLSYTFYETELPDDYAAHDAGASAVN